MGCVEVLNLLIVPAAIVVVLKAATWVAIFFGRPVVVVGSGEVLRMSVVQTCGYSADFRIGTFIRWIRITLNQGRAELSEPIKTIIRSLSVD